jgi:hypothetical protein
MITLSKPEAGSWKLLFTGGSNRAYIVTDMALNHNPQQPELMVGNDMVLESWLQQDGKLLDREAVLTNTRFLMEIEDPKGATARFDLFDSGEYGDKKPADGVYSNTLSYENAGSYEIRIIAEGETFQRQKTVHFEVAPLPAGSPQPEPEQTAQAEPQAKQKAEPDNVAEAEPQPEPEPEHSAAEQPPEAEGVADKDPEQQPQPAKEKKLNVSLLAGVFIGINLLLVAIALAVWWFLRGRNKGDGAEADNEANSEE